MMTHLTYSTCSGMPVLIQHVVIWGERQQNTTSWNFPAAVLLNILQRAPFRYNLNAKKHTYSAAYKAGPVLAGTMWLWRAWSQAIRVRPQRDNSHRQVQLTFRHMIMGKAPNPRTLISTLSYCSRSEWAETWILCESQKVNGLRREMHLTPVYVVFTMGNNSAEDCHCTSGSSRGQFCGSTEFCYILLPSVAAHGPLAVAHREDMYPFLFHTDKNKMRSEGRHRWTQGFAKPAWRPAHIHDWVTVCSSCAVARKRMHTQWRYSAPDNGIWQICLTTRQNNDKRFNMPMTSSGTPACGSLTLWFSVCAYESGLLINDKISKLIVL